MTTTLITGGAGFIGSHLAERLIEGGDRVLVIDDLSTGSMNNILGLKAHPRFEYVIDSIMNEPLMAELVDRADRIFHLAAAVGVRLIVTSPVRTIETNIRGTEIVLELANKKKKRVLLASTSEVYGKSARVPFTETDDMVFGPTTSFRWSYACSKAIDEFLAIAYWRENRLPVTIARLFNTVGPRQTGRYGMVIPRFVGQALRGEPLTVFGDGTQTRSFCHVSDTVRALIGLIEHEAAAGEIFNVGSEREITIRALAELVIERSGSRSAIQTIPYAQAYDPTFEDMQRRCPSIAKIRAAIGFEPQLSINQIVDDVIRHESA
ncbi:MAG: SDR family NAD(P)-dependent oxidoreductase [Candidatus Sumerlaeia bacterium]